MLERRAGERIGDADAPSCLLDNPILDAGAGAAGTVRERQAYGSDDLAVAGCSKQDAAIGVDQTLQSSHGQRRRTVAQLAQQRIQAEQQIAAGQPHPTHLNPIGAFGR